jgi:hypothetical protein
MYPADADRLNEMVAELKRRGLRKMTKSQLIRIALRKLNLDEITEIT